MKVVTANKINTAIIINTNIERNLTPIMSSAIPTKNISIRLHNPKQSGSNADATSTPFSGSMTVILSGSGVPQSTSTPITIHNEKTTDGINAIPPRRGTAALWIFRSSGSSKSFLRKDIRRICGMIIPVRVTLTRNAANPSIIQFMSDNQVNNNAL